MTLLFGESHCKLDEKGRLKFPASLKKNLHPDAQGRFVVIRGHEKCLYLYPFDEWEKVESELKKLDTRKAVNRKYIRRLKSGATELPLDKADRILIPRQLLQYAGIDKEVLIAPQTVYYELWNPETYEEEVNAISEDFSELAELISREQEKKDES